MNRGENGAAFAVLGEDGGDELLFRWVGRGFLEASEDLDVWRGRRGKDKVAAAVIVDVVECLELGRLEVEDDSPGSGFRGILETLEYGSSARPREKSLIRSHRQ